MDHPVLVLLVDTREVIRKSSRNLFLAKLQDLGVRAETRQLALGDFHWVVRCRTGRAEPIREYITNYIVERKTVPDLESSIMDGRYEEQKVRLKACPCNRVMYLVEGTLVAKRLGKDAIVNALASTVGINALHVRQTDSSDDSIRVLSSMHRAVERQIMQQWESSAGASAARPAPAPRADSPHHPSSNPWSMCAPVEGAGAAWSVWTRWLRAWLPASSNAQPLQFCDFAKDFSRGAARRTLMQCWAAMLRQLPGCSASRTEALLERWPTPASLSEFTGSCSPDDAIKAIADLRAISIEGGGGGGGGAGGRRIGPALAKILVATAGAPRRGMLTAGTPDEHGGGGSSSSRAVEQLSTRGGTVSTSADTINGLDTAGSASQTGTDSDSDSDSDSVNMPSGGLRSRIVAARRKGTPVSVSVLGPDHAATFVPGGLPAPHHLLEGERRSPLCQTHTPSSSVIDLCSPDMVHPVPRSSRRTDKKRPRVHEILPSGVSASGNTATSPSRRKKRHTEVSATAMAAAGVLADASPMASGGSRSKSEYHPGRHHVGALGPVGSTPDTKGTSASASGPDARVERRSPTPPPCLSPSKHTGLRLTQDSTQGHRHLEIDLCTPSTGRRLSDLSNRRSTGLRSRRGMGGGRESGSGVLRAGLGPNASTRGGRASSILLQLPSLESDSTESDDLHSGGLSSSQETQGV